MTEVNEIVAKPMTAVCIQDNEPTVTTTVLDMIDEVVMIGSYMSSCVLYIKHDMAPVFQKLSNKKQYPTSQTQNIQNTDNKKITILRNYSRQSYQFIMSQPLPGDGKIFEIPSSQKSSMNAYDKEEYHERDELNQCHLDCCCESFFKENRDLLWNARNSTLAITDMEQFFHPMAAGQCYEGGIGHWSSDISAGSQIVTISQEPPNGKLFKFLYINRAGKYYGILRQDIDKIGYADGLKWIMVDQGLFKCQKCNLTHEVTIYNME